MRRLWVSCLLASIDDHFMAKTGADLPSESEGTRREYRSGVTFEQVVAKQLEQLFRSFGVSP